MDFTLNEQQEMLKKAARLFLERESPESFIREMEEDDDGYSPDLWCKISDLGWLGLVYPEKYGGVNGSILDMAVLYEEMGRAMFPSPHLSTVVLCGLTILNAGTEEQKQELLTGISNGKLIMSLALTEPESSWDGRAWDPEGVTVRATRNGDDYVINGVKLFVHDAHIADYILCVARTRKSARPENGITLFLVDARSPGVSWILLKTMSGNNKQSEVVFNKVRVPASNIVGKLNGGWEPLQKAVKVGAVMLCAEMVGVGQRALELATDYARTRMQFDMPIGINQFVQEHVVQLLSSVDASRWLTYYAAWRLSEGLPSDLDVAMAKAWTSDAHEQACWRAHQVFAGVGSTEALHIMPLYTKRGNLAQFYLGDSAYHLKRVADALEELPPPERPKGKPVGLWEKPEEEPVPSWQPWRERAEAILGRKEERRTRKAAARQGT